ncbi:hypothetical protein PG999_000492 [Apiospora kogelbergensis]|uniref:Uncharacterized protein n=1 Tax=Apiospora kogelbergensis TaxID=1337665 RepID=A0AAW0RC40_9PEZI
MGLGGRSLLGVISVRRDLEAAGVDGGFAAAFFSEGNSLSLDSAVGAKLWTEGLPVSGWGVGTVDNAGDGNVAPCAPVAEELPRTGVVGVRTSLSCENGTGCTSFSLLPFVSAWSIRTRATVARQGLVDAMLLRYKLERPVNTRIRNGLFLRAGGGSSKIKGCFTVQLVYCWTLSCGSQTLEG